MNKAQKGLYRVIAVIFGAAILPVLFCVFFIGMKMNYTDMLKPQLALSNIVLFLIALPFAALAVFLIWLGSRHPLKTKGNIILTCVILALCVGLYFVGNIIAREIAFFIPWDVNVVTGSAMQYAKAEPLGYQFYYSIYTNNIPIVYFLGKIMSAAGNANYPYTLPFVWVQVGCALMTIGVFFLCMTVKRITKNLWAVIVSFLAGTALIGLSPWKIAPYTDAYGQPFPILCIYFYVCYRQCKNTVGKVFLLAGSILSAGIGGMIKPSLYLLFIAILMAEAIGLFRKFRKNIPFFLAAAALIVLTLLGIKAYTKTMPEKMGLEMNENIEAGIAEYFYMGLNQRTTGAYNEEDVTVYGEFQDVPKKERDQIVLGRAVDRMKDKGFPGLAAFWLNKMTMTFNDGTFGWLNEVWIEPQNHYQPVVSSNTPFMDYLRSYYWFGPRASKYGAFSQLAWFVLLLGLPGNILYFWKKNQEYDKETDSAVTGVMMIAFLGIFFYQMLFEARARYLFVFLPFIMAFAINGMNVYARLIAGRFRKKKESQSNE